MRTASFALALLPLAVAACVTTKPDGAAATRPSGTPAPPAAGPEDASALADAGASTTAARTPMPEGPPKWKSVPKEHNGFHVVVDGLCSELFASRVGKDVVVHYGGANPMFGVNRQGAASFMALREGGLESIGDPQIASPTGVAGRSLDDFWIADSTGTRSSEGAILHRYLGGTWKKYAKDQTNLHAWLDGGVIGTLGIAAANGEVWVEGSSTKPPPAMHAQTMAAAFSAFPTGEVLLVGRLREGPADGHEGPADGHVVARAWAPGKKLTQLSFDPYGTKDSWPRLYEVSPTEVYVVSDHRVARWDGAAFHVLGSTLGKKAIERIQRVGDDDVWVLTFGGGIQRITKEGATNIATPEPFEVFDGVALGSPWAVSKSGKLYAREGDTWVHKPLAAPAFSAQSSSKAKHVVVVDKDDVLVVAKYWEKAPGWKEPELHTMLQRSKPVKETLRCNEPDPENNNVNLGRGFQSWPPMATADCKTPFVVLARRSNAIKRQDDWPRLKKALASHAALVEGAALVEIVSGDRTFVGAKAKDLESAKKILTVAAKADRLRPEIVCGDPDVKRSIPLAP
jgi:hypothetical protein